VKSGRQRAFDAASPMFWLLARLRDGPAFQRDLLKAMEERCSPRATYSLLDRAEEQGLIASHVAHGKRCYAITLAGIVDWNRAYDFAALAVRTLVGAPFDRLSDSDAVPEFGSPDKTGVEMT